MNVVIFPNAKNVGIVRYSGNLYISQHIQFTVSDFKKVLKHHSKNKIDNVIFRFGDPMDNGPEFFTKVLNILGASKYENTKVIIESPMVAYLQKYGAWKNVFESEKVHLKAVFEFWAKDYYGKYFSEVDLSKAYSRFYSTFGYRPELIFYKTDKSERFMSNIERVAKYEAKAELEIRTIEDMNDGIFYTNDSARYSSSSVWFSNNPDRFLKVNPVERNELESKRKSAEAEILEKKAEAKRKEAIRQTIIEKEEMLEKATKVAKKIDEINKRKSKQATKFPPETKQAMKEARDKALETLNGKSSIQEKKLSLFEIIENKRNSGK